MIVGKLNTQTVHLNNIIQHFTKKIKEHCSCILCLAIMPRDNSKTSFTQKCLINMDEVTKKGNGNDKKIVLVNWKRKHYNRNK